MANAIATQLICTYTISIFNSISNNHNIPSIYKLQGFNERVNTILTTSTYIRT